jgi:hypothetical protein
MESVRHALCAMLLAFFTATAPAATHWICSVSSAGTQLICQAEMQSGDTAAGLDSAAATTAVVNGTRFPLDPARTYRVDMWSPPTEAEFVARLAAATVCYRSPSCTVALAPGPWLAAMDRQ